MYTFVSAFLFLVSNAVLGCELKFNLDQPTGEAPETVRKFFHVTDEWKTNKVYFFDDASGTAASKKYFIRLRLKDILEDQKSDLVYKYRGEGPIFPPDAGAENQIEYTQGTSGESWTVKYKIKENRFAELRTNLPPTPVSQEDSTRNAQVYFNEFSSDVAGDWNSARSPPRNRSGDGWVVELANLKPMGPIESRTKKFKLPCEGANSFLNDEGEKKFEVERWEFDGVVSYEPSVKVDPEALGMSCADISTKFANCLREASTTLISTTNTSSKTDQFMPLIHKVAFPSTNCDH